MRIYNVSLNYFTGKKLYPNSKGGRKKKIDYENCTKLPSSYMMPLNSENEIQKINNIKSDLRNSFDIEKPAKRDIMFDFMGEIARVNGKINPDIYDMEADFVVYCAKQKAKENDRDELFYEDTIEPLRRLIQLNMKGENFVSFVFLAGTMKDLYDILNNPSENEDRINNIKRSINIAKKFKV